VSCICFPSNIGAHETWCPESGGSVPLGEWVDHALCAGFAPLHDNGRSSAAAAVCQQCPVRAECATYGIELGTKWGTWGGLTPSDRRKVRLGVTSLQEVMS
jgi:hypothetical protein